MTVNIVNSVFRSGEYEETLQLLKDTGLFVTLRDAMTFSAVIGFREKRRKPLNSTHAKDDIQATVWNESISLDLLFCLAVSETKSAEILRAENEKECIKIFEEYANGGLELIQEWLDRYSDVSVEEAVWKGLRTIDFKQPQTLAQNDDVIEPTF